MTPLLSGSAPWESLVFCLLLLVAPVVATEWRRASWTWLWPAAAVVAALFSDQHGVASVAVAVAGLAHAAAARASSRTGAAMLAGSALLALGAAAALATRHLAAAYVLSTLAIAVRAGVWPLHLGTASLCARDPVVQTQQLGSLLALVFVHLRFVDHHPEALALAATAVRLGAAAALIGALLSLVARDLRGFYRATTSMHGGLILAGVGAASHDNFAAGLLATVAGGLALGGLGITIASLEERVGPVSLARPGGHARAFPRLTAVFALFGAAGVAIPGSAGFVADDLLLHTLWMESPASTVAVILASALLAVATLRCYARVFLGAPVTSMAPDLAGRERVVAATLLLLSLGLGLVPGVLLGPADAFLGSVPVTSRVLSANRP